MPISLIVLLSWYAMSLTVLPLGGLALALSFVGGAGVLSGLVTNLFGIGTVLLWAPQSVKQVHAPASEINDIDDIFVGTAALTSWACSALLCATIVSPIRLGLFGAC